MTRAHFLTRLLAALPLLGWLFREREAVLEEVRETTVRNGEMHKSTRWEVRKLWDSEPAGDWEDLDVPEDWREFPALNEDTGYYVRLRGEDGDWTRVDLRPLNDPTTALPPQEE